MFCNLTYFLLLVKKLKLYCFQNNLNIFFLKRSHFSEISYFIDHNSCGSSWVKTQIYYFVVLTLPYISIYTCPCIGTALFELEQFFWPKVRYSVQIYVIFFEKLFVCESRYYAYILMKFCTRVLIDPKNNSVEIRKSWPIFGPSPHTRVYRNLIKMAIELSNYVVSGSN